MTVNNATRRFIPWLAFLVLTACGAAPPPAEVPAPAPVPIAAKPTPPLVGWVERYVKALGADDPTQAFHGTLLLARGEDVIVEQEFGEKTGRRYRIGSVTKPFTAVALMQLADEGKLALDDSVRKHIPELPEALQPVTLGQLLSHRAGTASYTSNKTLMEARDKPKSQADMIQLIAEEPLVFEPGTKWRYSNSGYFLLGVVIERVANKPWLTVLQERVFAPSGMTDTGVTDEDLASPLAANEGQLVAAHPVDVSIPFSAGALVSTARDLHRFALALQSDTLLPAASKERMWQDQGGPSDTLGWGYGWMLREREGVRTVGHNGGIDGFTSYFEFAKQDGFIAVALSHLETFDAESVGAPSLRMALTDEAIEPPQPALTLPFDAAFCATLSGTYTMPDEAQEQLTAKLGEELVNTIRSATMRCDGGYLFKPIGQGEIPLERRDDGALVNDANHIVITTGAPVDATVRKITLAQGGLVVDYLR